MKPALLRFDTLHIALAAWIVVAATAAAVLQHAAGPAEAHAEHLAFDTPEHLAVLFFADPSCECSTGTIAELADRAAGSDAEFTVVISGVAEGGDWTRSRNGLAALACEGLRVVHDPEASIAARYGAATSGHTVVLDADGTRLFAGGLTSARGVGGPSIGLAALDDALAGRGIATPTASVFGCAISPR